MNFKKNNAKRAPGRPKQSEPGTLAMRESILRIASALFMALGFEPVSINRVAQTAGVTKASVYYYFGSKADLFTASVTDMMARIRESTRRILEQEGDLKARLYVLASEKLKHPHVEFETLMREASGTLTPQQTETIRAAEQGIHETMMQGFAKAMERGEIARGNPLLLSHAFSSLLMLGNRAAELDLPAGETPLSEQIVNLFWHGLAGP